ncbi:MAG: hypothetical protein CGW95_01150 [Phenylobacterium zucineum]|nr:MAG: hypothetical protein CGW95_01150 [Phenylobacterium zucineum]
MAATDSTRPVMAAVRSLLLADSAFTALTTQVFDRVPQKTQGTWVTIGDVSTSDWSSSDTFGQAFTLDIHVWHQPTSQTQETQKARDVMAAIRRLLHMQPLTLSAPHHSVLMFVTNTTPVMLDPDEATLHGVVSVRNLVENI